MLFVLSYVLLQYIYTQRHNEHYTTHNYNVRLGQHHCITANKDSCLLHTLCRYVKHGSNWMLAREQYSPFSSLQAVVDSPVREFFLRAESLGLHQEQQTRD